MSLGSCFLPSECTGKYSRVHLDHRVHLLHFELLVSLDRAHNSTQPQQKRWDLPGIAEAGVLQHKPRGEWVSSQTVLSLLVTHVPERMAQSKHHPWGPGTGVWPTEATTLYALTHRGFPSHNPPASHTLKIFIRAMTWEKKNSALCNVSKIQP